MLHIVPYRADPLASLADRRDGAWLGASLIAAVVAHVAAALVLPGSRGSLPEAPPITTEIIEVEPAVPPPPESPKAEPAPPAPSEPLKRTTTQPPSEPAPSPPVAPPLLTESSNENADLVDLTDTLVIGSSSASRGRGAAKGVASGAGSAAATSRGPGGLSGSSEPNRARSASVWGEPDWNCPFPPQADIDGVDRAVTTLRVELSAQGTVNRVAILRDPGHGFGAAAQRCAFGKRYNPALDREGRPIAAGLVINVRFVR
jgi:periplasmic protein TonB